MTDSRALPSPAAGGRDFEGDLFEALRLKTHFEQLALRWRERLSLLRRASTASGHTASR